MAWTIKRWGHTFGRGGLFAFRIGSTPWIKLFGITFGPKGRRNGR